MKFLNKTGVALTLATAALLVNLVGWAAPRACDTGRPLFEDCPPYNASVASDWATLTVKPAGPLGTQEWLYHKPTMVTSGNTFHEFTFLQREAGNKTSPYHIYGSGTVDCLSRRFFIGDNEAQLPWLLRAVDRICGFPQGNTAALQPIAGTTVTQVERSDYCNRLHAQGMSSSDCSASDRVHLQKITPQGHASNSVWQRDALEINSGWVQEVFNIDTLKIVLERRRDKTEGCSSGAVTRFHLTGVISPDSTYAMSELLQRNPPCKDSAGDILVPPILTVNSRGGLLADGYALGRELRRLNATVKIPDSSQCASSCAVAFLGGTRRVIDEEALVMFHAPYFSGENSLGKRDISCDVGEKALAELRAYYQEMTDSETGDRLFERTMWYCSADDGWVVKGASAVELYGIATEK